MAIVLIPLAGELALADFGALTASIAKWAHRNDLGEMTAEFVRLAEARFQRDLRLRCQVTLAALTTAAGTRSALLPLDWLEFKGVWAGTPPERPLDYVPFALMDHAPGDRLGSYTLEGDRLILGAVSDQPQTVQTAYYAVLPSLLQGQTNWLMTNHPSIYLHAALIECATYTRDAELLSVSTQRYQAEVTQLQAMDRRATHSGSTLRITPRGTR